MSIVNFVTDKNIAIGVLEDVLSDLENTGLCDYGFVCHILSDLRGNGVYNVARNEIKAFINKSIGWGGVGGWLEVNHNEFYWSVYDKNPIKYRIEWVKSMINELQNAIELENK